MNCNICGSLVRPFGNGLVLGKYNVNFFYCDHCGFMQTEAPYWLMEAYSTTITDTDIGLVSRNLLYSEYSSKFIRVFLDPFGSFIDYGGGYGLFVRMMRDQGFDFFRFDPITENIFAKHFDAEKGEKYDLLTAWEVFEHLVNPLEEIEAMLKFSDNILFSTSLLDELPKEIDTWWYYGLEHGQHVSFYSKKTLELIANYFSLNVVFSKNNTHFLSANSFNPIRLGLYINGYPKIINKFFQKRKQVSLLDTDYKIIKEIIREKNSK